MHIATLSRISFDRARTLTAKPQAAARKTRSALIQFFSQGHENDKE